MYDRVVGHDSLVSLHKVHLTATILSCFIQTVDRAALRAGTNGHAGDGLVTANAVHCSCSTSAWLQLLETDRKEHREAGQIDREQKTDTEDMDRYACK